MRIKFRENFNQKMGMDIFPTIRRGTEENEETYRKNLGKGCEIIEGEKSFMAKLIFLKFYPALRLVPDELLMMDSGKSSRDEALRFFMENFDMGPQDAVLVVMLKKINEG